MRRFLIPLAASALLLPAQADAAPRVTAVQPGASVEIGGSSLCTLNFVFQTPSKQFIGTAGHCGKLGDVARTRSPNRDLGTIVWLEYEEAPGVDFALIEIDQARYDEIEPAVRTFGGPVGVATASETQPGDLLLVTGYGLGFNATAYTRDRFGVLMQRDTHGYVANMVSVNGDSGGPVLHNKTGKALGTVGSWNLPMSTDRGPTLTRILQRLRTTAYPKIDVVTAPFP